MSSLNHKGLDRSDAEEIEARKARLDDIKRMHAERNGVAHPDMAPADDGLLDRALPIKPSTRPSTIQGNAQLLLDVAAEHFKPGDVVFPSRLATLCAINVKYVSVLISRLRAKGEWPYAPCGEGVRPENPPREPGKPAPEPDLREPDPEPIRNGDPKADPELLVVQRVLAQLDRLATVAARRRVLAYLIDREEE